MEVDTVPHVIPAKMTKKKKPAKKSRAQIKAAYMEKAKARATTQARQIDDLPDQPGVTITTPPARARAPAANMEERKDQEAGHRTWQEGSP